VEVVEKLVLPAVRLACGIGRSNPQNGPQLYQATALLQVGHILVLSSS
jgi:hypothetical protein